MKVTLLSLYGGVKKEVRFESYLDLIKKTLRQEWQYPKCEFLATCYLLNLGATRRYPELRGFAPFVIDPKLVMNSTIC